MIQEQKNKSKRIFRGSVVSDKMDKTVLVAHSRTFNDAYTGKVLRRIKKYKVHDEGNVAKEGDIVEFYEGKPIAKTKYMYLLRIIGK